ncbi:MULTISPECIES: hypothetical protein [unclassified Microcoleus]|uniref:hypothetical protein n=1 Tax=unclassified Microcoleus TaxID=2642155 RepID=UPI002FD24601
MRYKISKAGCGWRGCGGKQFWLSIGLPETPPSRKAAEIKARTIELDMGSGNFDPSLAKYKAPKQAESICVVELFDQFMEYKRRKVEEGTFAKYLAFQKQIANFFKNKAAISISERMAENFCEHLAKTLKLEPITV